MKNEKNNFFMKIDEEVLSQVSGGSMSPEASTARFSVGQTVRFSYFHHEFNGSYGSFGTYYFNGKVVEVLQEPDGIRYRLEVDEMAQSTTGQTHLTVGEKNVIEAV